MYFSLNIYHFSFVKNMYHLNMYHFSLVKKIVQTMWKTQYTDTRTIETGSKMNGML